MPPLTLDPIPPFVWPDPRVLSGSHAYAGSVPFDSLLNRAKALAGVVSGVDLDGARWLAHVVSRGNLRCRLVTVLYAACPTQAEVLRALLELQSPIDRQGGLFPEVPSVELRILPFEWAPGTFPNGICILDSEAAVPCLVTGSSPNFGLGSEDSAHLNFAFHPDPALLEAWQNWFKWVWAASVPLTAETAAIPALVPAPGTAEAAEAWHDYLTRCREARAGGSEASQAIVRVDPESGKVTVTAADGTPSPDPGEALGLPSLDPLAAQIARIFCLGALAAVDKTSRIPPLDVPVKAELFGISSRRQAGVGSRRVEYRFSVLDDQVLKDLEGKRKMAGDLLRRFTFPLGDGVRWMPHRARSLFEAELDRLNKAGREALGSAVGDDVAGFVAQHRTHVEKAAQALFEEHRTGQRFLDSDVNDILEKCKERLRKALGGRLLPRITYTPVQFVVGEASEWASPWGQAGSLLHAIAEFPRKALTDRLFLRGLDDTDDTELLEAMDVCSDAIQNMTNRREARTRAHEDLKVLARLADSRTDARGRCELILRLIGGARAEAISAEIPDEEAG